MTTNANLRLLRKPVSLGGHLDQRKKEAFASFSSLFEQDIRLSAKIHAPCAW